MGYVDFQAMGGAVLPAFDADAPNVVLAWSDPRTWTFRLPNETDVVSVPAGRTLLIDQSIHVAGLIVHGTVLFAARDLDVRVGGILVLGDGVLRAGDSDQPFKHRLTITLTNHCGPEIAAGLGRKFMAAADGGVIELCGPKRVAWAMLGDTVFPGGVVLKLMEPVDWRLGERIVIASGGADLPLVEERAVAGVSHDRLRITLDRPLAHRHLGHYAPVLGALPGAMGRVALLSRDIVVEGDAESDATCEGAHCLVTAQLPAEAPRETCRAGVARFSGVEFRRVGQFNRVGRYPLHWSHNEQSAQSALLHSVIHQSYQRGVVVENASGVRLLGNVVYRPLGHGFIVDQADDGAALLTSNLAIRPRVVRFADPGMRAMCEHRPRAVWFSQLARPRTLEPLVGPLSARPRFVGSASSR
ncbi:MAG TPA: G8 domain-containing protein [Burkholderiaceae bacterium]|nr:G8 domain-containing protein [Burkholderiaceae bacterium]